MGRLSSVYCFDLLLCFLISTCFPAHFSSSNTSSIQFLPSIFCKIVLRGTFLSNRTVAIHGSFLSPETQTEITGCTSLGSKSSKLDPRFVSVAATQHAVSFYRQRFLLAHFINDYLFAINCFARLFWVGLSCCS